MGVYLSKAKTAKESDDGGNECTRYGVSAMQGWRQSMEDAHIAIPSVDTVRAKLNNDISLYGVFDGHGGPTVSEWIARHFSEVLAQSLDSTKRDIEGKALQVSSGSELPEDVGLMCEALQRTFLALDCEMATKESREEIQKIHEQLQAKQKEAEPVEGGGESGAYRSIFQSQPKTLLQALLGGSGGRPMIRIVEQDGERFFQISPPEDEEEEAHEEEPRSDSEAEEVTEPAATTNESGVTAAAPPATTLDVKTPSAGTGIDQSSDFTEQPRWADVESRAEESLEESFASKAQLPTWGPENCGAAAIVAALVSGSTPFLVTANAGDSRCVLCRNGQAISMSEDHKPGLVQENNRIVKAGGTVIGGRVDGNLNLSRTIGDLFYKSNKDLKAEEQKITAFPDVRVIPVTKDDEFVILACDGIWDCVSNQEAVNFVKERLGENPTETKLSKICEELCDHCLADNPVESEGGIGCDNMTCIVVLLNDKVRQREVTSAEVTLYESSKVDATAATKEVRSEDPSPLVGDKAIDVSAQ
eukprot:Protomagalhaensia_sp_Gyna_25__942@NODE_1453_length_1822_cov_60_738082_g1176_i0_p1_GENE_NODE_1453_length_1822_cov_60_738082_g1176_i0NODE_1453_length_1822_cov_60_738082_g1176_i0_p1_ORF_typecomplete_len530_score99_80PP2C/PF00481_21/3_3e09PP2C/PF00481_21/2_5e51PP2C_2/PF13672_6/0_044PP2C_2/PF13672_6/3_5e11SpoIIE/PF07228_12/4_8e08SapB_1/PF05184_15/1_6e03SapB_1/PF05184_15/0_19_NODE_1453_length_1822_cov_60_738082_g1176_i01051694